MTADTPHESMDPPTDAEAVYFARNAQNGGAETVDIDALCLRHPGITGELRDIHEQWERFQSVMREVLPAPRAATQRADRRPSSGAGEGAPSEFVGKLSEHRPPRSRYQVRGKIAQGGMGAILKVWDEPLNRDLAMKVMLAKERDGSTPAVDERLLSRFLEEALITGQLDHPGVVPVHELGVDQEGQVFFTMRLVQGRDLKAVFEFVQHERDGWNRTRALNAVLRACEALAFAHSKGVIHRDLKPANIMVGLFGEVYVMDWGLAKVRDRLDSRDLRLQPDGAERDVSLTTHRGSSAHVDDGTSLLTMDGTVIGTPAYMSPEQASGEIAQVDTRSDVYSMGTILYELLTGRPPYVRPGERRPPRQVLESILSGPPTEVHELATVPAELEAICQKAMARKPVDRYGDIVELVDDLRAYLEHRVVTAYETGALAELRKWVVRNKGLAMSLGAVMVLLLTGGGVFAWLSGQLAVTNADLDVALTVAQDQRELADVHAAEARANASEATVAAAQAEAERSNVLRLSAFQKLEDLQREADELWPATPALLSRHDDWLGRAEKLVAGLEPSADGSDFGHRAHLTALRERALPLTAEQREADRRAHPAYAEWAQTRNTIEQTEAGLAAFREGLAGADPSADQMASLARIRDTLPAARQRLAELGAELSERRTFTFASGENTWWHNQLSKLIDEIEAFADEETGLIDGTAGVYGWGIRIRRDSAATLEERTISGDDARRRWKAAISSIANRKQCPAYGGLALSPQLGLLPIGRDLDSGLWEFWHVQSGDETQQGEDGKLRLTETCGIVLVLIPGGSFWMGAQREDPDGQNYDPQAYGDESPVHEVGLSPYFLSKYEMTQAQWTSFVGHNPSDYGPDDYHTSWNRAGHGWSGLHPVERVSWEDCGQTLARFGLTLPTEAQWERGCRAGTSTPHYSGIEPQSLQDVANLSDQYGISHGNENWAIWESWLDDGQTVHAPVGSYRANGLGLHDMHGNVWEWCLDGYYSGAYARSTATDPVDEPFGDDDHVFRGGSFALVAADARSASRNASPANSRLTAVGLRPARVLTE